MSHVIGVEKNSLARALGAQNVEWRFALSVMRGRVVRFAFNVVGRLKTYRNAGAFQKLA